MRKRAKLATIDDLREFLREYFKDKEVEVYLFGSRANGEEREGSDVDLAFISEVPLSEELALLREICEESLLPYKVDLLEFRYLSRELKKKILQEGIKWL